MIEFRDLLALLAVVVSVTSVVLVTRNARRANAIHTQNVDLTRIRDLRSELRETKEELDAVKLQATKLIHQLEAANAAATEAIRQQHEMIRYGQMPGVDMQDWLARFDVPPSINGRMDG